MLLFRFQHYLDIALMLGYGIMSLATFIIPLAPTYWIYIVGVVVQQICFTVCDQGMFAAIFFLIATYVLKSNNYGNNGSIYII